MKLTVLLTIAIVVLGLGTAEVYAVRGRLAAGDADPAIEAWMRERFATFPVELAGGRYRGRPLDISRYVEEASGTDIRLQNRYVDADGGFLFDVFLGGSIRNEENFHSPTYCMPASNWVIDDESITTLPVYGDEAGAVSIRRLLARKDGENATQMLVYYWFQAGDRVADHAFKIRWLRFLDLLRGEPFRPTLIVSAYAPILPGKELGETEKALREFLEALGPHLRPITRAQSR